VAGAGGTLSLVKVKSAAAGHVKVAIYDDSEGQSGALRNANNTGADVVAGQWNDITIPSTTIASGTAYWLAVNADAIGAVMWNPGSGTMLYGAYSYSSNFPSSAPSGYAGGSYHSLVAGWSQ